MEDELIIDGSTILHNVFLGVVALLLNAYALLLLWKQRPWTSMEILLAHVFSVNAIHPIIFSLSMILFPKKRNTYMFIGGFFFVNIRLIGLMHIGIQRLIVVYFPLRVKQWLTTTRTHKQMAVTYGVILIIFGVFTAVSKLYTTEALKYMILLFVIECVVMVAMYAGIFIKYVFIIMERKQKQLQSNNKSRDKQWKPMVVSVSITIAFLCSNLPVIFESYRIFTGSKSIIILPIVWFETIFNSLMFIVTAKYTVMKKCFQRYRDHESTTNTGAVTTTL